jgi:hypothetical protein
MQVSPALLLANSPTGDRLPVVTTWGMSLSMLEELGIFLSRGS